MASSTQRAGRGQLLAGDGERDHDLDDRLACPRPAARRPPPSGPAPAWRRGPGLTTPRRTPRVPSIGLNSCQLRAASSSCGLLVGQAAGGLLDLELVDRGQELVQRRVEQAHGDRAGRPWPRGSPRSRPSGPPAAPRARPPPPRACRPGSCAARRAGGPRRGTCARCGTGRCPRRRTARALAASGPLSALARTASLPLRISSAQLEDRRRTPAGGSAAASLTLAEDDLAGGAVERDHVALADDDVADGERLPSICDGLGADHGRDAPAAGDDGGVADTRPPRAVRMPSDTNMPCTSSGLVSRAHEDDRPRRGRRRRPRRRR